MIQIGTTSRVQQNLKEIFGCLIKKNESKKYNLEGTTEFKANLRMSNKKKIKQVQPRGYNKCFKELEAYLKHVFNIGTLRMTNRLKFLNTFTSYTAPMEN